MEIASRPIRLHTEMLSVTIYEFKQEGSSKLLTLGIEETAEKVSICPPTNCPEEDVNTMMSLIERWNTLGY